VNNRSITGATILVATLAFGLAPLYRSKTDIPISLHHVLHAVLVAGAALAGILLAGSSAREQRSGTPWLVVATFAPVFAMLLMWPSEYSYFELHPYGHVAEHLGLIFLGCAAGYGGQRYANGIGWASGIGIVAMAVLSILGVRRRSGDRDRRNDAVLGASVRDAGLRARVGSVHAKLLSLSRRRRRGRCRALAQERANAQVPCSGRAMGRKSGAAHAQALSRQALRPRRRRCRGLHRNPALSRRHSQVPQEARLRGSLELVAPTGVEPADGDRRIGCFRPVLVLFGFAAHRSNPSSCRPIR
jgi:hypothetical protein